MQEPGQLSAAREERRVSVAVSGCAALTARGFIVLQEKLAGPCAAEAVLCQDASAR